MFKNWEVGETYKNGYGQDVRIICNDLKDVYPLVGVATDELGDECLNTYTLHGKEYLDGEDSLQNLIPPEKIMYIVEQPDGSLWCAYEDKHMAIEQYGKKSGHQKPIYRYVQKERVE